MFTNIMKKIRVFLEMIKGPSNIKIETINERRLVCFITDVATGEEASVEISCKTICHNLIYLNPLLKVKKFKLLEYKMTISDTTNASQALKDKGRLPIVLPDFYPKIPDSKEKVCLNTAAYLDILSKNDN